MSERKVTLIFTMSNLDKKMKGEINIRKNRMDNIYWHIFFCFLMFYFKAGMRLFHTPNEFH